MFSIFLANFEPQARIQKELDLNTKSALSEC